MVDLNKFNSFDDLQKAFLSSPQYKGLTDPTAQDHALALLRQKWEARPGRPGEQPDITARLNEKIGEAVKTPLGGAALNAMGPLGAGLKLLGPDIASRAVKAILPNNNIQAAIDAAMLATGGAASALEVGGPAVRLGLRLAIPTVAGAVGGATEGKAGEGALSGFTQQAGGEVISPLTRLLGKNTIGRLDRTKLGGWLKNALPTKLPFNSVDDFDQALRGGLLRQEMGPKVEQANAKALEALGTNQLLPMRLPPGIDTPITLRPGQKAMMNFEDALATIRHTEDLGRYGSGTDRLSAKEARVTAHQMVEDLKEALNARQAGLGDKWIKSRKDYSLAMTLQHMFNEPGVLDPKTGQINMGKLQQLSAAADQHGYRDELKRAGVDQSFLRTAFRNARNFVKIDQPGQFEPYWRFHLGVVPTPGVHPKFPLHVGYLPYDLGRGRALSAALTLGPRRLLNLVAQESGRKAPYPDAEPKELPPTKVVSDEVPAS